MANDGKFLERLWDEIINLDIEGKWFRKCIDGVDQNPKGRYANAGLILNSFLSRGVSTEDLGGFGRFVRYETCFQTISALEESDPDAGNISKLYSTLSRGVQSGKIPKNSIFTGILSDAVSGADGEWLVNLSEQSDDGSPFADAGPTIKRLFNLGITPQELQVLASWHSREACLNTLNLLLDSGFENVEEIIGFHESILEADPSGMEGRTGSWPFPPKKVSKKKQKAFDPKSPLWKTRSGQCVDFSPDGKMLAVGAASGPARLYDAASGTEKLSLQGIKSNIFRVKFSPDGRQVAVADIYDSVALCDANTGKCLRVFRRMGKEVSGLAFAPTGEVVCSSWENTIRVYDFSSGVETDGINIGATGKELVTALAFFPNQSQIAAIWNKLSIWSWPEKKLLREFPGGGSFELSISPDGKLIARCEGGVVKIINSNTGEEVAALGNSDTKSMVFTPTGKYLIATMGELGFAVWDYEKQTKVCKVEAGIYCYRVAVSSDGEYLAVTTTSGVRVWKLKPLVSV